MYTKSLIQQELEKIHTLESFKNELSQKMDQYMIEDAVFGISDKGLYEATRGYFVTAKEYDNLDEAVRSMSTNQLIHVLENKRFIVGDAVSQLSNCPYESKVYDIEFLCEVR